MARIHYASAVWGVIHQRGRDPDEIKKVLGMEAIDKIIDYFLDREPASVAADQIIKEYDSQRD